MATYPATGVESANAFVPRSQGVDNVFTYEEEFDLSDLISAAIVNADVVNLIQRPANHMVVGASLKIVTAATMTGTSPTFTLQLRDGTTALGAALTAVTENGIAIGGSATYNMPLALTTAANINVVAAIGGTTPVVTLNPKIKVKLVCVDMS